MQDNIFILPIRSAPTQPGWAAPNNLPSQLTPFIGREVEVAAVCALLHRIEVRLLTLTGFGGVGKTRLALQVADTLLQDFPDGIFFVSLAPISDPDLVLPTIAHTLDLWESRDQSLLEYLKAYLRNRQLLLLLDNFEQVVEAAPLLVDLLQSCPHLKILVTSRATLHLYGEYEYIVPTLSVPDLKHLPDVEELLHYAAIELFMQQAQAIKHDFQLSEENARAIVEICVRLDGLPLALELAASRIKLLPPKTLLERLENRLSVLTGGARNLPLRQQTLRNTIAWSYDLLSVQEQRLFRHLSVFVGGCTLEAIEAVCRTLEEGEAPVQVLKGVASLIDKSLLQRLEQEEDELRFGMFETIREYGLECLAASGEAHVVRYAHVRYFLALAQEAESNLYRPEQEKWLARLEREHGNVRVALSWLLECEERDFALQLSGALWRFWQIRGHFSEGRNFLERGLAESEGVNPSIRAKAFYAGAWLAWFQNDPSRGEVLAQQSLALYRQLADKQGIAGSLRLLGELALDKGDYMPACSLAEEALLLFRELGRKEGIISSVVTLAGVALVRGEYVRACSLLEEALTLTREMGDKRSNAHVLWFLGMIANLQGDAATARALLDKSLIYGRELGYTRGIANSLVILAFVELSQGDLPRARLLFEEGLAFHRKIEDRQGIAWGFTGLSWVAFEQGDYPSAHALFEQSLTLLQEVDQKWWIILCLEGLSGVAAAEGKPLWAARLLAVADAIREVIGAPVPPVHRTQYENILAAVHFQLSKETFTKAWAEGRSMTLEQVLAARDSTTISTQVPEPAQSTSGKPSFTYPAGLTEREVEVLRLVAQGLTNPQIAKHLIISLHTVNAHVRSIFNKLNVNSRNSVTRFALDHQLI